MATCPKLLFDRLLAEINKNRAVFNASPQMPVDFVIIISLLMEKKEDRERIARRIRQPESYRQSSDESESKAMVLRGRIRKTPRNKKSKRRLKEKQQEITYPQPEEFLQKKKELFDLDKQKVIERLTNKIQSNVHIKNIIRNEGIVFTAESRENYSEYRDRYVELIKLAGESQIRRIKLVHMAKGTGVCLNFLRNLSLPSHRQQNYLANHELLWQGDQVIITKRLQIMDQIVSLARQFAEERGYLHYQVDHHELQISTLSKLTILAEDQIINELHKIKNREDILYKCHEPVSTNRTDQLLNELAKNRIIKNLIQSFDEKPIDYLNYHKTQQFIEKTKDCDMIEEFDLIKTFRGLKAYLKSKKNTNSKSKGFLKTPCSACLSDFYQMANPFIHCDECHIRIHRGCQNIEKRCHRCRYCRTSNLQKQQSRYCYICDRQSEKGLLILTVNNKAPHRYAHNYCLLLHNKWRMENQIVVGDFEERDFQAKGGPCSFCEGDTGLFFQCKCCKSSFHGMCAFLEGCSFQMAQTTNQRVEISCCIDLRLRERLSFQRKFKINFQKFVFKNNCEITDILERKMLGVQSSE